MAKIVSLEKEETFNKTATTIALRGILKKLITLLLVFSSMYFPLKVPMQGKNKPQQISNVIKEEIR